MKKKIQTKNLAFKIIVGLILTAYAISILFVIYWCIVTSLKTTRELRHNVLSLPKTWAFDNYPYFFENFTVNTAERTGIGLLEILRNTLVYTFGGAFIATFVPCIVAYVTSRFKFRFSKVVYVIVVITMALPIVGSQPSAISIMQTLGLYDNLFGALAQKAHFLTMYYLIFYAGFSSLSKEYVEAAYIDGASEVRIFFRIIFPLLKTMFLTIMLIYFIDLWNDYQAPLVYLPSFPTLATAVHLNTMPGTSTVMSRLPMRMISCILMVVPTTLLFLIFKNKMMGNLSMGGVKG